MTLDRHPAMVAAPAVDARAMIVADFAVFAVVLPPRTSSAAVTAPYEVPAWERCP
jgi:hypothetical protein